MDSGGRYPLQEVQRNINFSGDEPLSGFSKTSFGSRVPSSKRSSSRPEVSLAPPTMTAGDLLRQDSWSFPSQNQLHPQPQPQPHLSTGLHLDSDSVPIVKLATPVAAATPAPSLFTVKRMATFDVPQQSSSWMDILTWRDPVKSGIVFVTGCAVLAVLDYIIRGDHGVTLTSGVSAIGLGVLALHFLGNMFSPRHRQVFGLSSPGRIHALTASLTSAAEVAASFHDRIFISESPRASLKVAGCLWALHVVGRYLSVWTLVCLGYCSMFMLPLVGNMYAPSISSIAKKLQTAYSNIVKTAGLSRGHALAAQFLIMLSIWLNSSLTTRLATLLIGLIAVRCQLNPDEMETIIAKTEPYTMSVKKQAGRVSRYITSAYSGGKSHAQ